MSFEGPDGEKETPKEAKKEWSPSDDQKLGTSESDEVVIHGGMRKREQQEVHQSECVERANNAFQDKISGIFMKFDADGSGTIDRDELKVVLVSMGYSLNDNQLDALLEQVDVDGNGTLDLEEFTTLVNLWRDAAGYKIFDDGQSMAIQHINNSTSTRTDLLVPDIPWRWVWDTVYMCVGCYYIITVLMVHTFENQAELDRIQLGLIAPDLLGTIFLLVEMVMKTQTVVKVEGEPLIATRREIMRMYFLSPYFLLDVVTALPLRLFTTNPVASNTLNHARLLIVFRFQTLWPTSGLVTITSRYVRYMYGILPYIQGTLTFACSILLLTVIQQFEVRQSIQQGLVGEEQGTFAACLYWTLYVVAGVGYGDTTPQRDEHRWYAGFLFMVSMIVNGLFVGSMVSLMQEADVENSRRSSLVLMQAVLRFFHVPESLQEEILQFQNHILQRDIAISYADIVDMLPGQMRHNILMQTNVPLLQGVHTFRSAHTSTIVQIAEQMTSIFASPEVYIAVSGDRSRDLCILNYGFIDVLTVGRYVTTLKRGGYFGEMGILDKDNIVTYRYSFKALTYCDLFLLPVGRLIALEHRFPKFSKDMANELLEVKGKPDRFDTILLERDGDVPLDMHHPGPAKRVEDEEMEIITTQAEGLLAQRSNLNEQRLGVSCRGREAFGNSMRGREAFGGTESRSPMLGGIEPKSPGQMGNYLTGVSKFELSGDGNNLLLPGPGADDVLVMSAPSFRSPRGSLTYEDPDEDGVLRDLEIAINNEMEAIMDLEAELILGYSLREDQLGLTEQEERESAAALNDSSGEGAAAKSRRKKDKKNKDKRRSSGKDTTICDLSGLGNPVSDEVMPMHATSRSSSPDAEGP